jgi:hypothetical protein
MRRPRDGFVRRILRALERQGWRLKFGRHVKAIPPDPTKAIVVSAATGSDHRGVTNWVADLRRSGFRWPEAADGP